MQPAVVPSEDDILSFHGCYGQVHQLLDPNAACSTSDIRRSSVSTFHITSSCTHNDVIGLKILQLCQAFDLLSPPRHVPQGLTCPQECSRIDRSSHRHAAFNKQGMRHVLRWPSKLVLIHLL
eukprot:767451-Hanusia_phi.AAC.4